MSLRRLLINSYSGIPAPDRVEGKLRPGTQGGQALLDPRLRGDDTNQRFLKHSDLRLASSYDR